MKKLLAMVLAAVMVLSLCSCATAEETVALRVWVGDNADLPWINSVIENFKAAHPEKTYDIAVDIQGEGDCSKRVLNDTEAAADVFTFADDQFNSLMNAEALQQVMVDADEIIAANGGADAGAVQASTGADGNLYAYPATADNGYFMFYNKEYFTEEDVQTLDGMLAKAAAAGKYVGFPMSDAWYLYSFFQGAGLEMHVTEDGVTNTCNWNATDTEITGVQVVEALLAITSNPGFREANSDPFVAGVKDGSIDCVVTDHAPHTAYEKAREFELAPFGMVGLETSLGLMVTNLVKTGAITWSQLVELMAVNPRRVLRVEEVSIAPGSTADLTVIDPDVEWTVDPAEFASKAKNSGFAGAQLVGRATDVYVGGYATLEDGSIVE